MIIFITGVLPTSPVRTFRSRRTLSVNRKSSENVRAQTLGPALCQSRSPTVNVRLPWLAETRLRGKLGRLFVCF